MKKLLCIFLTLLTLASPAALAVDESAEEPPVFPEPVQSALEITGETVVPEKAPEDFLEIPEEVDSPIIEVIVPKSGHIVINPYGLPVTVEGRETTEQIAGSTMLLENRSTVAVDASVSAVGETLGGVVFAEQPPVSDAWEKEVFLYAEFQPLAYLEMEPSWSGYFADDVNQILITPSKLWKDGLMRLEAIGEPYSWAAARLFGSVAAYPEQPWEAGDGFRVDLAFTFTPVLEELPVFGEPWDEPVELPDAPVAEEAPDEIQEEEPNLPPDEDEIIDLPSELEPEPEPDQEPSPDGPPEADLDENETPGSNLDEPDATVLDSDMESDA